MACEVMYQEGVTMTYYDRAHLSKHDRAISCWALQEPCNMCSAYTETNGTKRLHGREIFLKNWRDGRTVSIDRTPELRGKLKTATFGCYSYTETTVSHGVPIQ